MKRYGPYIFVTIAICLFVIPLTGHAKILKSQEIYNGNLHITDSTSAIDWYQGLGNNVGGSIYSVGMLFGTSTLFNLPTLYLVTCNGPSATTSSCTSYSSNSHTPTSVPDNNPHLITYVWNTAVTTVGKYVFIKWTQPSYVYLGSGIYAYGSQTDTYSEGFCGDGNSNCSSYYGNIEDEYFIVAGENSTFITQPPTASTWYVNPQGFVASIPGSIASTTLKWNVHFGQISGAYTETSDYGYINQTSLTGEYMIPTNFPFAINATSTWYMKPYIYADYDNDGTWTLVKTGDETYFTVAPASVVYSGGYSGLDGQMHYYNLNNSVTGLPATTTAACSDTNGISYYFCVALTWAFVPPDCVISSTGQTSCTSFTRFSTVLDAYSEKAPWGYYGRFKQLVNDMASSTTATSTFSGLTDWLPTEGPLYTFIEYFKTGTAVLIWFTSVAFTLKIATLFL